MTPPENSSGNGTRLYSDSEVDYPAELDLLIDDLTQAAVEAIERAAGEAARAAALASVEREAAALWEASLRQAEALRWRLTAAAAKRAGIKNAIITGAVCLLGGLALGIGGTMLMRN
jgi:hypothetical protein